MSVENRYAALLQAFRDTEQPHPHQDADEWDAPAVLLYSGVDGTNYLWWSRKDDPSPEHALHSLAEAIESGFVAAPVSGSEIVVARAVAWHTEGGIASTSNWSVFRAP